MPLRAAFMYLLVLGVLKKDPNCGLGGGRISNE
jgi:hypothetical protein